MKNRIYAAPAVKGLLYLQLNIMNIYVQCMIHGMMQVATHILYPYNMNSTLKPPKMSKNIFI